MQFHNQALQHKKNSKNSGNYKTSHLNKSHAPSISDIKNNYTNEVRKSIKLFVIFSVCLLMSPNDVLVLFFSFDFKHKGKNECMKIKNKQHDWRKACISELTFFVDGKMISHQSIYVSSFL